MVPRTDSAVIPIVSGAVKPVTDSVVVPAVTPVIEAVKQACQEGENKLEYLYIMRKRKEAEMLRQKRRKSQNTTMDDDRGNAKIKRTIFNKLGSLETMFGSSAPKKTAKKSTKRARKA